MGIKIKQYINFGGEFMAENVVPIADISQEEWDTRVKLAACYRLFVKFGWTDLIFTHLSARVPDAPEQYLNNPYGLLFEEITPSGLFSIIRKISLSS